MSFVGWCGRSGVRNSEFSFGGVVVGADLWALRRASSSFLSSFVGVGVVSSGFVSSLVGGGVLMVGAVCFSSLVMSVVLLQKCVSMGCVRPKRAVDQDVAMHVGLGALTIVVLSSSHRIHVEYCFFHVVQ